MFNAFTNLCARFAFVRLLVGVEILAFANPAYRSMLAHITVKQAAVALAPVAVAIAWLLIESFLDAGCNAVSILSNRVPGEERRAQGRGQLPRRHGAVKSGNGFRVYILCQTSRGPRRGLRNRRQSKRDYHQNEPAQDFLCPAHIRPPAYCS